MQTKNNYSELIGFVMLGVAVLIISFSDRFPITKVVLPESLLTFNMVFLSILIEAIPFVLIGVFIAGSIQIFVTEEHLKKLLPKNKFLAIVMSCLLGALFPACECGIVPIVRRLIAKGVPLFAGVGFLLTGPLINPIVIFSTYMAFGEDMRMALLRMGLGLCIAIFITTMIYFLFKQNQLKRSKETMNEDFSLQKQPFTRRVKAMLEHSIDEFFDMGKFLIIGAILAAFVQTYISTQSILGLGEGILASTVVMMGLAYLLSLCSEADAFIAASFRHLFPQTSLLSFLIYGPMIDLKNTIMMLAVFKVRFILVLFVIITGTVLGALLFVHQWI